MGKLFKNELLKIKYSTAVWGFWAAGIILVAMMATVTTGMELGMNIYGYTSSFAYMRMAGTFVVMLMSPVAGALFTQELRQGTMHNTLSCGVSRAGYFIVKAACIYALDLLMFFLCLAEFVCIRTAVVGWLPRTYPYSYPDYGLVNLLYHSGTCLLLCTYISFFLLLAVSMKKPSAVYLSGAAAVLGELSVTAYLPEYKGVMPAMLDMYGLAETRKVLTPEFAALFGQGAVMGIVFLALAFVIFMRRDIN